MRHRILIVTQGDLARSLLAAAETIVGAAPGFETLCLSWDDTLESARVKLAERLGDDPAQGVLILTDMFGGTPSNVARAVLEPGRVELVTGVNLPMVVRLACRSRETRDLVELARWIRDKGRSSIRSGTEVWTCDPARRDE